MIRLLWFFCRIPTILLLFFAVLVVPSCAPKRADLAQISSHSPSERILSVPFYAQGKHECGPAALAMVLGWNDVDVSPAKLRKELFTPGRQGTFQADLKAASRNRGFLAYEIYGIQELIQEVSAGHPVLVLQNLGLSWLPSWHYAVVVGYDLDKDQIILHSGDREELERGLSNFTRTWGRSEYWGLLVLAPGAMPETAKRKRYLQAVLGLEQAEQWESASRGYDAALSRWPKSLTAAMGKGNSLYRLGDLEGAKEAFRRALRKNPEKPQPYNNLAHVLLELEEMEKALRAAERAVQLSDSDQDTFKRTLRNIESKMH